MKEQVYNAMEIDIHIWDKIDRVNNQLTTMIYNQIIDQCEQQANAQAHAQAILACREINNQILVIEDELDDQVEFATWESINNHERSGLYKTNK